MRSKFIPTIKTGIKNPATPARAEVIGRGGRRCAATRLVKTGGEGEGGPEEAKEKFLRSN